MKSIECEVIQDLLPSYSDKIASNATKKLVEEHLQECEKCKKALRDMDKYIDTTSIENQTEKINYLKGFKKRKNLIIVLSIILTIIVLLTIFIINILNKNILIDRLLYLDVNQFNVEYMYIKENEGKNFNTGEIFKYKTLQVYLYSDKYEDMYIIGSQQQSGNKEIYIQIAGKTLPKGVKLDATGIELTIRIDDNTEKIFIIDTKNNIKEIWNKNMKIQTEEEWKTWYIENYVPNEIKQLFNMNYDSIPHVTIWKKIYNSLYIKAK